MFIFAKQTSNTTKMDELKHELESLSNDLCAENEIFWSFRVKYIQEMLINIENNQNI